MGVLQGLFQIGSLPPFGYKVVSIAFGDAPGAASCSEMAMSVLRNTKELDCAPAHLVAVFEDDFGNCRLKYWKDARE